jgi:hypothetical protein
MNERQDLPLYLPERRVWPRAFAAERSKALKNHYFEEITEIIPPFENLHIRVPEADLISDRPFHHRPDRCHCKRNKRLLFPANKTAIFRK